MHVHQLLYIGLGLALLQGDVKKVTDDVAALKPSIFAAVPRVLDRMKSGIEAKIKRQPGWKQGLFRVAYNLKRFMRRLGRFDFVSHWTFDVYTLSHVIHTLSRNLMVLSTCQPLLAPPLQL